jgi:hypothetical protein
MAHGYSLRPNSKGRRMHKSTDETKEQVEGTSTSTSTSTSNSSTSKGRHRTLTELEGESGTVDPRPATPDTPRAQAAHNPPWTWHSRNIVTSSASTTSRHHIDGPPEAIQAARRREEARRTADAIRIRREQTVRCYEEELRVMHARVLAHRHECVLKVKREERKWAIERGEVEAVVEDDEDGDEGSLVGSDAEFDPEDADGGSMAVDKHNAETATTSLTTNHDDDKQQWERSSRSSQYTDLAGLIASRAISRRHHFSGKPNSGSRQVDERGPAGVTHTLSHTGRRLLRENHPSQGPTSSHSRPRPHHPQPLRRQRTQLMGIPTSSHSHGLHMHGTYGTTVPDPGDRKPFRWDRWRQ